jgi:hypothetical protein
MTTAGDVFAGRAAWSAEAADCVEWLGALPPLGLDLVVGSPPYTDARTYGVGAQRGCEEWVAWMLRVTEAAHRACKGPVFWVVGGVTRDRCYWPGCEGLAWEWWRRGGDCQLYRPCVYRRVGIPGSGGDDYLRADWEYVLCFKHAGKLPWSDNTACGHPPKWAPGGEMSHRMSNGKRVNAFGVRTDSAIGSRPSGDKGKKDGENYRAHTKRVRRGRADGDPMEAQTYEPPAIANPGTVVGQTYTAREVAELMGRPADVLDCVVGGGQMGNDLASKNEAPFPERLPEFFVRSFAPPGGIVCDPFLGSGTTAAVSLRWGRRFVGCDIRSSQVALTRRRVAGETPLALFAE